MSDNDNTHSNRQLSSIQDHAEEETLTLGGPTAKEEGTEYQFISEAGREAASGLGRTEKQNVEQKVDTGREPEYYFERQTVDTGESGDESDNSEISYKYVNNGEQ